MLQSTLPLETPPRPLFSTVGAYVRLTKPRVIELLLVTAVPPMILAQQGMPGLGLIAAVVVGGALAAGGANTINCWIERDRDQLMKRTHSRPLPQGEIVPGPGPHLRHRVERPRVRAAGERRQPARR